MFYWKQTVRNAWRAVRHRTRRRPTAPGTQQSASARRHSSRFQFRLHRQSLINGVVDPAGTRNSAVAIEAFLQGFLPISSPTAGLAAEPTGPEASPTPTTSTATSSVVVADTETPSTDLSLAYVQRSWVQDFVTTTADAIHDDEELLIALPE